MTNDEISALVLRWQQNKDQLAATDLYNEFKSYMEILANKSRHIDSESAINYAFYKAINNYKPNQGSKFITFLTRVVENEIIDVLRNKKLQPKVVDPEKQSYLNVKQEEILSDLDKLDIEHVISRFSERDSTIIRGILGGNTFQEMANLVNMSKCQTHYIYTEFLAKIKQEFLGI